MEPEPSGGTSSIIGFCNNSCSSGKSGSSSMGKMLTTVPPPLTNLDAEMDQRLLLLPLPWTDNGRAGCSMDINVNNHENGNDAGCNMKAKIMSHPLFPRLLTAYANCQKIGAPPEVAAGIDRACANSEAAMAAFGRSGGTVIGSTFEEDDDDPALNQFMEAYCEMLTKYEQELTKPLKEAMIFFSKMESQLHALAAASASVSDFKVNNGSSSSSQELGETLNGNGKGVDPEAEEKELKIQLLNKYSGYVGCLKQEFMKKKKNGKLPKEARQQLLDWWNKHYKWPYPSESEKVGLAESSGLDLKQINNWFINQRKRHWKPSEDLQFVIMDGIATDHHHHHPFPRFYFDNNNVLCSSHFTMTMDSTMDYT